MNFFFAMHTPSNFFERWLKLQFFFRKLMSFKMCSYQISKRGLTWHCLERQLLLILLNQMFSKFKWVTLCLLVSSMWSGPTSKSHCNLHLTHSRTKLLQNNYVKIKQVWMGQACSFGPHLNALKLNMTRMKGHEWRKSYGLMNHDISFSCSKLQNIFSLEFKWNFNFNSLVKGIITLLLLLIVAKCMPFTIIV